MEGLIVWIPATPDRVRGRRRIPGGVLWLIEMLLKKSRVLPGLLHYPQCLRDVKETSGYSIKLTGRASHPGGVHHKTDYEAAI